MKRDGQRRVHRQLDQSRRMICPNLSSKQYRHELTIAIAYLSLSSAGAVEEISHF